ncbi:MAG: phosphotransferase [Candidatus Aminicenantes bacterium]|nr:phosphotransferase [Candidatus Aminicenantes bacterium]
MPNETKLPEALLKFLASRPGARLQPIRSEASQRRFFRISQGKTTRVAMVYPEPAPAEVKRFLAVHEIYRSHRLRVPVIEEVLGNQVVIQEDAGDLLLQKAWRERARSERQCLLDQCRDILGRLAAVPPALAKICLDRARQKWEMDFFVTHFFSYWPVRGCSEVGLRQGLGVLVDAIAPECVFAHRDFHSRNLLVRGNEIIMVDCQDSLLAPRWYDLVSLAFDSYLDLGAARARLFPNLVASGIDRELRQLRLTALQRNIKALGTFAYQIHERRHPAYARYIPRTLRHIRGHLQVLADPELEVLNKYFNALIK